MKKTFSFKYYILSFILVAVTGVGFYLFYTQYAAIAGSPEQELERLFGDMGVLKMPHATRPLEIQLKDITGNGVRLSDFRGKIVFLNFWATWCPPCVDEMPSMEKLYQELTGEGFEILAVSIDESGAKTVRPFMKKHRLSFPALIDSKGFITSLYQTTGVPESFILDKDGIIVEKVIGPRDWAAPGAIRFFRKLIRSN